MKVSKKKLAALLISLALISAVTITLFLTKRTPAQDPATATPQAIENNDPETENPDDIGETLGPETTGETGNQTTTQTSTGTSATGSGNEPAAGGQASTGTGGNTTPEPEQPSTPTAPSTPSFSSGTVISSAISQISTFMTHLNGPAEGMGYFDFGFSTSLTEDRIISGLVEIYQQEENLYGNTVFDIAYLGISGNEHIFRLYRA